MHQGGTGQGGAHRRDGKLRGDEIQWLAKDGSLPAGLQRFVHRVGRLRRGLAAVLCRPLPHWSLQLARFPGDGKGFVRHRDSKLNDVTKKRRRVTLTYYFNASWEEAHGGRIRIFPNSRLPQLVELRGDTEAAREEKKLRKAEGTREFAPCLDTLLAFQSHTLHEVDPVHAPRLALSVFIAGPESLGLTHPVATPGASPRTRSART